MNGNGVPPAPSTIALDDEPIRPRKLTSPLYDRSTFLDWLESVTSPTKKPPPRMLERSSTAFSKLPPEVILRILGEVDSNGFASLCLINRTWYQQAQRVELYAHHLSRCPSYALTNNVITGPFRKNDIYRFKTKFAAEVKRNLFDAYLRPRQTHINLISVHANSSAAFPGGEAFRFEFSPSGRTILALSSSRIYVLDATTDSIVVKRELKTARKPLSASITDDGSLLAVLSSRYQANIYALNPGSRVKHLQVIVLDNPPRTIALAHEGTVLAAAYEGGIEVFSLASNALSTDRRAVRSEAVDSLIFSGDGSMLVGSSQDLEEPNAVVITAPFYTENDPNITPREIHSRMWTTQILFPQISSTVSHAALLPGHSEGDTYWLFAYDHTLMTYRAVRTDDTRTGVAYFLSPSAGRRFSFPTPSIAPSTSACGTIAVAGFSGLGLSLYGIPEKLDTSPDMGSVVERNEDRLHGRMALTSATGQPEPLMAYSPSVSGGSSEEIEEDSLAGKVDWRQSLFVKCKSINVMEGFTCAKWVEQSDDQPAEFKGKRLVVTAPGGVGNLAEDLGEESMPVDGSRICLFDFEYGPRHREDRQITIEVGDNEAELLSEQIGNLDVEVAMERRRTVRAARDPRGGLTARLPLGRSITAASPMNPSALEDAMRRGSTSQPSSPNEEDTFQSRSSGLARAATAAGFHQARFPPRPPLGTPSYHDFGHTSFYRPGGHGARNSADSWESPPPPYGAQQTPPGSAQHIPPGPLPSNPQTNFPQPNRNSNMYSSNPWQGYHQLAQPYIGSANHAQQSGTGRPSFRQSTTLDGMMTSDAPPSLQRPMNQFGGISRITRGQGNLDSVSETTGPPPNLHRHSTFPEPGYQPPPNLYRHGTFPESAISPMTEESSYFNRTRPSTHDGSSPEGTLGLRSTITHPLSPLGGSSPEGTLGLRSTISQPLSPPMPDAQMFMQQTQPVSPVAQRSRAENRLSLTGANLLNRLNHPVPPVPTNGASQARTQMPLPSSIPNQQRSVSAPMVPPGPNDNYALPRAPTPDQLANLNRRSIGLQQRVPTILQAGHSTSRTASRDFGNAMVQPAPPTGAWGAVGVNGAPNFNRAIASPNGLSRNNSRGSQRSLGASHSTPNLLSHINRPPYGRLDTIDSVDSTFIAPERERSQSMIATGYRMAGSDTYSDSRKGDSDKKGRKSKWKKEEVNEKKEKKGSRCIVM